MGDKAAHFVLTSVTISFSRSTSIHHCNNSHNGHVQRQVNEPTWNNILLWNPLWSRRGCWIITNFQDTKLNILVHNSNNILNITCQAPQAGKMNQILCCDWLPKQLKWGYLAHSGLPNVSCKKMVFFMPYTVINPLLTNSSLFSQVDWILAINTEKTILHVYGPSGPQAWSITHISRLM